jgi:hypothetical protein
VRILVKIKLKSKDSIYQISKFWCEIQRMDNVACTERTNVIASCYEVLPVEVCIGKRQTINKLTEGFMYG